VAGFWLRFGAPVMLSFVWIGLSFAQVPETALTLMPTAGRRRAGPVVEQKSLKCPTETLYRGDMLTVELLKPHDGYQFMILDPDLATGRMLSFKPVPKDRIAPAIPPDTFAKLKRVSIRTSEAQGPLAVSRYGDDDPHALAPVGPIFTKTGDYEVALGTKLNYDAGDGAEEPIFDDFDACWVHYVNRPRTKHAVGNTER
jgi:hypothetical protein